MSDGLLLDTHALLWLENGLPFRQGALNRIANAATTGRLFASHISIWELGVALGKRAGQRPNLRGLPPGKWMEQISHNFGIRMLAIAARIASEAGSVPSIYGSGDPGDCFLIATARMRKLILATRDAEIIDLAQQDSPYLNVLEC